MKHKYTKEEVQITVAENKSMANVMRLLGIPSSTGSQNRLKVFILEEGIDISHFTGQSWKKNDFDYSWMKKDNLWRSNYAHSLIYKRGRKCESCGLSDWLEKPISIEVHHIDGDKNNNVDENLQLLCPNCHSQTENWRKKKSNKDEKQETKESKKESPKIFQSLFCEKCGTERDRNSSSGLCRDCYNEGQRTVERPDPKTLVKEIVETSFLAVGRKYGVSDNSIRKWCVAYNIPKTKKSLEEWLKLNQTE